MNITYEATSLLKIDFTGNTNELDSSANPDSVVVIVVGTRSKFQSILGGGKHGAASLVVE